MQPSDPPAVIAHRGACGYLPEHTLEAKALAFGFGADHLEQDVVASRDGELFVLHDLILEEVTDVAERYPERCRADGRWYARDFDAVELVGLRVRERVGAGGSAVYRERFPSHAGIFRLHTLDDEIAFCQGLARSTGRPVQIWPEIKEPAWHRRQGFDLGRAVVDRLARSGWEEPAAPVFLQCADPAELRRLHADGCRLRMLQLLYEHPGEQGDWQGLDPLTEAGMRAIATYAYGLGPWLGHVLDRRRDTGFTRRAQAAGLRVYPWTLRRDALPPGWSSFEELNRELFATVRVDGAFSDFPDLSLAALVDKSS